MFKIFDKMDHVDGGALVFLLSVSCAYLTSVDIFPEGRVVVNKEEEFQIICKNLLPANSWYSLTYVAKVSNVVIPLAYSWKDMTPCNKRLSSYDLLGNMRFSCNYTVFVLTVFNASLNANNVFIGCSIYVGTNDDSVTYTKIKVKEPLNEPDVAPNGMQIITENLSTTFQCTARSYPAPAIFWYINDRRLSTSTLLKNTNVSTSTLTYKANRNDNGQNLYCTASNEYESANSSMIMLEIRYLPNVTIIPDYTTYNVINGTESLIFGCSVTDASPAVTQYAWYKTGTSQPIVNQINLLFSGVTVFDNGNYFCQAENTVGLSISPEIQVNVLYGVKVNEIPKNRPLEGSKLMITCTADSNPQIMDSDIIWTKKDNTTFRDRGQLVIANVNREDSGVFICTVTLNLKPTTGMAIDVVGTTTVEVDVFFKPLLDSTKPYSPSHVTATINSILHLTLTINANPLPTIEWTFRAVKDWNSCNFVTIVSNTTSNEFFTTSSVLINNVNSKNFGDYVCTARNTAGVFSRRFIAMEAAFLGQEMFTNTTKVTGMFFAGIVTLVVGLLSLMASVVFVVRNSLKNKTRNSSKTNEYSDVQRSNPAFTDAYNTLQSDIETRAHQEQIVNTYEECGRISEQHAYSSVDNMKSEPSQPRQHRHQGVNTSENCGKRIEAHAYDTLNN